MRLQMKYPKTKNSPTGRIIKTKMAKNLPRNVIVPL